MTDYLGQTADIILGQEFLTWLWFSSEMRDGRFETLNKEDVFHAFIEQRISVEGGEGETLEKATVSGSTSDLSEARRGLATGKKVTRALIRIEHETESWQLTLKAEDFTISSLKTPKVEKELDESGDNIDVDGMFLEKMYLIESCLKYVDELFMKFVMERLNPDTWSITTSMVKQWIAATSENGSPSAMRKKIEELGGQVSVNGNPLD